MEKAKQAQKEVAKAAASALKDKVAGEEVGGDKEAGDKEAGEPGAGGAGAGEQAAGGGGAGSGVAADKQISVRVTWEVEKLKHMYGQVFQLVKQEGSSCTLKSLSPGGAGVRSYEIPLSTYSRYQSILSSSTS